MKHSHLPSLSALIKERLSLLGIDSLPAVALTILERDVLKGVNRSLMRSVTGPKIGRAVATALDGRASHEQGFKGGTPLTSQLSGPAPAGLESVAGHSHNQAVRPLNSGQTEDSITPLSSDAITPQGGAV